MKSNLPLGAGIYRRIKASYRALYPRGRSMQAIFSEIYEKNQWADEQSVSGRGSRLERTEAIRLALPTLLKELNARTLLDVPCGDFNWMRHTALGPVKYTGADVVPSLIARNQRLHGNKNINFMFSTSPEIVFHRLISSFVETASFISHSQT